MALSQLGAADSAAPPTVSPAPADLDAVASVVRTVAMREVMPRFRHARIARKSDGSIVTDADTAAQAALETGLRAIFDCPVVGEEMTEAVQRRAWNAGSWCWCVDPLDGTGNFANGKSYFAVSVALVHDRVSQLGAVYAPCSDEMFTARRGSGAWFNGMPMHPAPRAARLGNAAVEVGLFKNLGPLKRALTDNPPFRELASSGASALQWCHLADGRFDLFLHPGENPWDYAAGALVLEEAGGRLATFSCDDYWSDPAWRRSAIAAASPALFDEWALWVRSRLQQFPTIPPEISRSCTPR
jgi:myo-inositol-1(or 4)-monophosphatase